MALDNLLKFKKSPVLGFLKDKTLKLVVAGVLGVTAMVPVSAKALLDGGEQYRGIDGTLFGADPYIPNLYDPASEGCFSSEWGKGILSEDGNGYFGFHDRILKLSRPVNEFEYSCSYQHPDF